MRLSCLLPCCCCLQTTATWQQTRKPHFFVFRHSVIRFLEPRCLQQVGFPPKLFVVCRYDKICIRHCFLVDKGSDRYASPDTGRAWYRSEPLSTKKQCHMHFIVRPPTCLIDNMQPQNELLTSFGRYRKLSVQVSRSITPVGVR